MNKIRTIYKEIDEIGLNFEKIEEYIQLFLQRDINLSECLALLMSVNNIKSDIKIHSKLIDKTKQLAYNICIMDPNISEQKMEEDINILLENLI